MNIWKRNVADAEKTDCSCSELVATAVAQNALLLSGQVAFKSKYSLYTHSDTVWRGWRNKNNQQDKKKKVWGKSDVAAIFKV